MGNVLAEAIALEKVFQEKLCESFSSFVPAEESLLKLASYGELTDGIFYILPFRLNFNDETIIYSR